MLFWGTKQEILQRRFGVTWFRPDEMKIAPLRQRGRLKSMKRSDE